MGRRTYHRGHREKQNITFLKIDLAELEKSRHSREAESWCLKQRNPYAHNFFKRMGRRLRTSGMTVTRRILYEVVELASAASVVEMLFGF